MCDEIRHRGPDDEGYRIDGRMGMGMRPFSIIDLAMGRQPIANDRRCRPGTGTGPNREIHLAFAAAKENAVRAFHAAALRLGAECLHEPRLWPEYHPGYFAAFVRDPDGNNVEAVWHGR